MNHMILFTYIYSLFCFLQFALNNQKGKRREQIAEKRINIVYQYSFLFSQIVTCEVI